jgi:Uma2 family endonuclease
MQKAHAMSAAQHVTAEELLARPRDDRRWELVRGQLVRMSPVNFEHGRVVIRVAVRLDRYVERQRIGVVVTEVGFVLETSPDTVRAPDVAFVRQDRVPVRDARGFFVGAPDLAIEVLSPDDRQADVDAKVAEYLAHGVVVVGVVDPVAQTASIFRRHAPVVELTQAEQVLDLSDVVPGFRCALSELF